MMAPSCGEREVLLARLGQAEVGDLEVARVVDEQVARLDVAVDEARAVRVGEGPRAACTMSLRPASGSSFSPRTSGASSDSPSTSSIAK